MLAEFIGPAGFMARTGYVLDLVLPPFESNLDLLG